MTHGYAVLKSLYRVAPKVGDLRSYNGKAYKINVVTDMVEHWWIVIGGGLNRQFALRPRSVYAGCGLSAVCQSVISSRLTSALPT